ncbi:MAG: hypothetical protein LAO20_06950 [Acidobacteriia bacterium]|nr:hypothetical protein [Terriglobia bacterium]
MANVALGAFADPKQLELVNTIILKTQQGKLRWNKSTSGYHASLPNDGQMVIAVSTPILPFLGGKTWAHFVVRQKDGTEILKVENSETNFSGIPQFTASDLEVAVKKLYGLVSESATDAVEKVIDQLKHL